MNFTQVVAAVSSKTQRPDLTTDIKRAVNAAINFCTIEANFARDVVEDSFAIDPMSYVQSLPLSGFVRWRKIAYIRPANRKKYLQHLAADKIFNAGKEACDVYYVAGDSIKLKLSTLSSDLLIGYLQYAPELTDASPTYWLLDVSPYMIIDKACASIFSQVGNTTESQKHEQLFAVEFSSAVRDYKYGVDYG